MDLEPTAEVLARAAGMTSATDHHAVAVICDACQHDNALTPYQFATVAIRFLVWTGLQPGPRAALTATGIVHAELRRTAAWMRRQFGGAAGVQALTIEDLEIIRNADTNESGVEVLTWQFIEGCVAALRAAVHPLSKCADDVALRDLVSAEDYDPIRARYLAAGGTKPLISLWSKTEWADAVDDFFGSTGRGRGDLYATFRQLLPRTVGRVYARRPGNA